MNSQENTQTDTIVKRGRGRPRKTDAPIVTIQKENTYNCNKCKTVVAWNKRGRKPMLCNVCKQQEIIQQEFVNQHNHKIRKIDIVTVDETTGEQKIVSVEDHSPNANIVLIGPVKEFIPDSFVFYKYPSDKPETQIRKGMIVKVVSVDLENKRIYVDVGDKEKTWTKPERLYDYQKDGLLGLGS